MARHKTSWDVRCPECGRGEGQPCQGERGLDIQRPHPARVQLAQDWNTRIKKVSVKPRKFPAGSSSKSAKPGRYFVHVPDDVPVIYYDNDGKGYSLAGAKQFARIGSGHGKGRAVTRGKHGPVIRVYSGGERLWPLYADQLNGLSGKSALTRGEVPRMLVFKIGGRDKTLETSTRKVGRNIRIIPARNSRPWRGLFLKEHPAWRKPR
jgi:hypothetical protein